MNSWIKAKLGKLSTLSTRIDDNLAFTSSMLNGLLAVGASITPDAEIAQVLAYSPQEHLAM